MKILQKLFIALTASLFFVGSVSAGTINTYQFVNNGSSWSTYGTNSGATPGTGGGINLGASQNFTGSNGLQATVTFFEDVNKSTGAGGSAVNGYHGHGLAVIGGDGFSSRVDNDGEAILFSFANNVTAKSSFFWGYGSGNSNSNDVDVFYSSAGSWVSLTSAVNFSGYRTLGLNDTVSDRFLFVNTDGGNRNDTWVLKGFAVETIETTSVSEPGSFGLIALGLAAMVISRRRRVANA